MSLLAVCAEGAHLGSHVCPVVWLPEVHLKFCVTLIQLFIACFPFLGWFFVFVSVPKVNEGTLAKFWTQFIEEKSFPILPPTRSQSIEVDMGSLGIQIMWEKEVGLLIYDDARLLEYCICPVEGCSLIDCWPRPLEYSSIKLSLIMNYNSSTEWMPANAVITIIYVILFEPLCQSGTPFVLHLQSISKILSYFCLNNCKTLGCIALVN